MTDNYTYDSEHKKFIRQKWVDFTKETLSTKNTGEITIITLPSHEMQDLKLFVEKGLIDWQMTETGAYEITKGNVICFEKKGKIYRELNKKLVNANLFDLEIGIFLQQKQYQLREHNYKKIFPADMINLDFDGCLSKNETDVKLLIQLIFELQSKHQSNFSLFLTFPQTETEDVPKFKEQLTEILKANLEDENNLEYSSKFETMYISVETLTYPTFLILGVAKLIIKTSSHYNYDLTSQEFYTYGEEGRRKMAALLFNFKHPDLVITAPRRYYKNVVKLLCDIIDL